MTDLICFEQLYRDYAAEMYAVCYKYSGDTVLSADAVQDVFISLWERKDSLSIDNPQHYLLRAAKLKLLEYHRSESKRLELY